MNTKKEILNSIKEILTSFGVNSSHVVLTNPTHIELGDYTSNVAMAHAKELGRKPLDLALEIKESLVAKQMRHITRIDVIAPGFINFFLDEHYFGNNVGEILNNKEHGKAETYSEKTFVIEHTQPNPFKEFHIGHLMNNTIGEAVSRIVKENGAKVHSCTYHGDVGLHVAKAIWAIQKDVPAKDAYAEGHKAFEGDADAKKEITDINKQIYSKSDKEINKIYNNGRTESFNFFESMYKRLDSHFDEHFYESQSGEVGQKIILENVGKVFDTGENGAVIFKGENFGLHTRVFLNSEGLPTYEAKEVGLAQIKKEKWQYDQSITITANEQDAFFDVVEVAIGQVFPELNDKLKHLSHGMLKLPSGKMSSRTGSVIPAEKMIDDTKEKVLEKMNSNQIGSSASKLEDIAEMVAIGAIKYSILRQAIGGDIIFDFEKSLSFEGDSGPYLQYSAVRANSVLKRAQFSISNFQFSIPENWKTTNLEKLLERYPEVVERAGTEYAPHYIVTYLTELAGEFNSFYASNKILDVSDTTSPYKLSITKAFVQTITNGLDLLGIKVPSEM